MKHRFISFLLSLLLLISAQGAFAAATLYSVPAGGAWETAATWNATSCAVGTGVVGTVPAGGDTVVICAGTAPVTVSSNTPTTALVGLTVATGGTLSIGAFKLLAGPIDTAGTGSINIAAGGELAGTTLTTVGSGAVTGATTAKVTLSSTLIVGAGTKVIVGAGGLFTAAGVSTTTGTAQIDIADGGNLTLVKLQIAGTGGVIKTAGTGKITASDTTNSVSVEDAGVLDIGAGNTLNIAGLVTTAGTGEIKIADGGKLAAGRLTTVGTKGVTVTGSGQIVLTGALTVGTGTLIALGTSGALEVGGAATVASTGTITGGTVSLKGALTTYDGGITGIVKPIVTGQSYTFTDNTTLASFDLSGLSVGNTFTTVTSTLTLTNILNGTIECPAGSPYSGGTTSFAANTCTVKTRPSTVFAPLFSTKEKAKVFVEEVNR